MVRHLARASTTVACRTRIGWKLKLKLSSSASAAFSESVKIPCDDRFEAKRTERKKKSHFTVSLFSNNFYSFSIGAATIRQMSFCWITFGTRELHLHWLFWITPTVVELPSSETSINLQQLHPIWSATCNNESEFPANPWMIQRLNEAKGKTPFERLMRMRTLNFRNHQMHRKVMPSSSLWAWNDRFEFFAMFREMLGH